jgi:flagellar L-ring protein precursor FlgH
MKHSSILSCTIAFLILANTVFADNLFNIYRKNLEGAKAAKDALRSPVSDMPDPPPPPILENDLIQVIVEESARGTGRSKLETDKRSRTELNVDKWFSVRPHWKTKKETVLPEIDTDFRHRSEGMGEYSRSRTLRAKIQAMVVQVYPNGNLLIEAKKTITLGDEIDSIIVTGIIRSEDVDSRRQISSTKVFDLRVVYTGKGVQTDASTPGWFSRFINRFWPF